MPPTCEFKYSSPVAWFTGGFRDWICVWGFVLIYTEVTRKARFVSVRRKEVVFVIDEKRNFPAVPKRLHALEIVACGTTLLLFGQGCQFGDLVAGLGMSHMCGAKQKGSSNPDEAQDAHGGGWLSP